MDVKGNILNKSKGKYRITGNVGDYDSLAEQLAENEYCVIRFETNETMRMDISTDEVLREMEKTITSLLTELGQNEYWLMGHGYSCNLTMLLSQQINPQGMILLCGAGASGEAIIRQRYLCGWKSAHYINNNKKMDEYVDNKTSDMLEKIKNGPYIYKANKELLLKNAEYWKNILESITIPTLAISVSSDWHTNNEQNEYLRRCNPYVKYQYINDTDFTFREKYDGKVMHGLTEYGYLYKKGFGKYRRELGGSILDFISANS